MMQEIPEGFDKQLEAIAEVLGRYKFDYTDPMCMGLLSRISRAYKTRDIDFVVVLKGSRYIHIEKLREWASGYIQNFKSMELQERAKLEHIIDHNRKVLLEREAATGTRIVVKFDDIETILVSRKKGGEATNKPWAESREYCVSAASHAWKEDELIKVVDLCEDLFNSLLSLRMKCPQSLEKIKKWLYEAEAVGKLHIPHQAKPRRGRPPKNTGQR